jgi:hypothetical protein
MIDTVLVPLLMSTYDLLINIWDIFVSAQSTKGVLNILWGSLLFLFTTSAFAAIITVAKKSDDEELMWLSIIFGAIIYLAINLGTAALLHHGIIQLLNPEYAALKEISEFIKQ